MTKQPDITPAMVKLLATGMYLTRQCSRCHRIHLALVIAPPTAPCLRCVRPMKVLPQPPAGRPWSTRFLAFMEGTATTDGARPSSAPGPS
jgi:hypothetical protein